MMSLLFCKIVRQGLLPCLILLSLQSCEVPPEVRVTHTAPPAFTFSSGTVVDMRIVYHGKPASPRKGVFLDEMLEDKPNILWMIEGKHDNRVPITYGSVPTGMKETVLAKPLAEGEEYLVFVGSP